MNAIQKASDRLRESNWLDDHKIADELEALLKQEPVGEVRVELAAYPGCTPHFAVSWKGRFIPQFETKLYADPRPPCDLKALAEAAFDAGEDYGKALIITKDMPTVTDKPDLDAIIAKHTGGK
jgi:hypothetical protein